MNSVQRTIIKPRSQKIGAKKTKFQKDSHSCEKTFNSLIICHTSMKLYNTNYFSSIVNYIPVKLYSI